MASFAGMNNFEEREFNTIKADTMIITIACRIAMDRTPITLDAQPGIAKVVKILINKTIKVNSNKIPMK